MKVFIEVVAEITVAALFAMLLCALLVALVSWSAPVWWIVDWPIWQRAGWVVLTLVLLNTKE